MEVDIAANINTIKQRIAAAAARCNRAPDSIKLLAVTKTVTPVCIGKAIEAGLTAFGENYVQEASCPVAYDWTSPNQQSEICRKYLQLYSFH